MNKLFPNLIIIKTKHFTLAQDWDVPISAFFIISTNRKCRSVAEFTKEEAEEFISLLCKTRKGMGEILNIKDVYLFQNEDTEHGFHLWLFPRQNWMEQFGRKVQSVRPIMEYAKKNMANNKVRKEVRTAVEKMKSIFT